MRQRVQISEIYPDGTAEVRMLRESACSGDCHKCGGCSAAKQEVRVRAKNEIGAQKGDWVYVESDTGVVFSAIFLLYALPIVMLFLGYFLGFRLSVTPGTLAVVGFVVGLIPVWLYDKFVQRRKLMQFRVTGFA